MVNSKLIVILTAIVFFLVGISGADALNTTTNTTPLSSGFTSGFVDINTNTALNISLTTNASDGNVSSVTFSFAGGAVYVAASNQSSLLNWAFTAGGNTITWAYGAGATLFQANTSVDFIFNITAGAAGELPLIPQITVAMRNATGSNLTLTTSINIMGDGRASNGLFTVNFALNGFVKNETGQLSNNTNVSVYAVVMQPNLPPVEWFLRSIRTDANGFFNLTGINATSFASTVYRLKIIHYNASGTATKVGPTLPPFPGMLFSPPPKMIGLPDFEAPPTLNGTTFNLQPAVTLNISAINVTGQFHSFGYEVSDIASGFPIDSSIFASISNVQVVVPAGRDYNVMAVRAPGNGVVGFLPGSSLVCDGAFINASTCPSMPRSNASTGTLTAAGGSNINLRFNMTDTKRQFTGCLSVSVFNATRTNITNITGINPRMMPYAGFIPPVKADDGSINLSNQAQVNMTAHKLSTSCPVGAIAYFNITLLSSTYLVEFYGANDTVSSTAAYTVGVVQNVSLALGNVDMNLTMKPMLGSLYAAGLGAVNTSKMLFNFTNSSGTSLAQAPNAELVVYYPQTGKIRYMIDTTEISSGIFYFPIVNETNVFARVNVYGRGPPVEKKVNLSATKVVVTIDDGQGFGFRRILANGTLDNDMNVSSIPINMRFLTNSAACNVVDPAVSCELATMTAANFNPFKVMMAGKVNMEMKIVSSGVRLTFINYDLFQAKPPTNSIFKESADTGSGNTNIWKFGSFAPADAYDYVIIAMPYSESTFDENKEIRVSVPVLYDENQNVIWNRSASDTQDSLTYDYAGAKSANYNSTGYRELLNATGVACSTTDSDISSFFCYIDRSANILYMRVPHFSSIGPQISGSAVGSTTTAAAAGGGGGGGGIGEQSSTVIAAEVNPGAPATLGLDGKRIGVSEVVLDVLAQAKDVSMSVTKLVAKPASVTQAASGTLYSYFSFSISVPNTNIKLATIKFQVPQKWIASNSIDKTTVSLQRWETSKWTNLGAKLLLEDADFAYYESTTTGFSTFAVTAEKIGAVAEQKPAEATTPVAEKAASVTAKPAGQQTQTTAVLVVIAIVVIAAIAYTMMPRRRRRW